ncbi:hypothetical protein SAMN04488056_107113 [Cohaesibacter marisflavi]|uniref:YbgF trimerisation domain-containing protein n=1 Tax=Cohaesibacter marisflavi TaxID=655353 RepID=A0A1I5HT12_9HYPH|nr:hypothetical protein [Cohaesibacter marisflavi]SFO51403.1 hypothetical protein SAMN04488056_107113 [Cohaesibacter marisflavi]
MVSQSDLGMKRLFSCRVLFASLFLMSSGQLSLAQSSNDKAVPQVEQAPMDEDWHNEVSTKALLSELTRLATQLEEQRKENASLAAKVDRLTKRLDGMQTQLANAGYGATAPKMLPEDLDSGSGAISLSDDPAPEASTTDAASPKALPLAGASTNSDGATIGKQEAAKEGAVERAPLTPLDAPEGTGTTRRSPEEGGYFSRLVKKSEKVIDQITDW